MNGGSALVVMVRSPGTGEDVKTRLAAVVPDPRERAALYLAFVRDLLATCRAVPAARLGLACTAAAGITAFEPLGITADAAVVQRGGDLGARERAVFEDLFAAGWSRVVLVGSDLPTLPSRHLAFAFELLGDGQRRVVLGPSTDGGYYLMGLCRPPEGEALPDLFTGIRWSTVHAFADTVAAAAREELEVALVPGWYDVDDEDGFERLRRDLRRSPELAPATREILKGMGLLPLSPKP